MESGSPGHNEKAKLRRAFRKLDKTGTGKLTFDDFIELLHSGNSSFPDEQAAELFHHADEDLSGEVDFNNFLEFLYNDKQVRLFSLEDSAGEEEAKAALLSMNVDTRTAAAKRVKARGDNWRTLSWCQRLEAVREYEQGEDSMAGLMAIRANTADPSANFRRFHHKPHSPLNMGKELQQMAKKKLPPIPQSKSLKSLDEAFALPQKSSTSMSTIVAEQQESSSKAGSRPTSKAGSRPTSKAGSKVGIEDPHVHQLLNELSVSKSHLAPLDETVIMQRRSGQYWTHEEERDGKATSKTSNLAESSRTPSKASNYGEEPQPEPQPDGPRPQTSPVSPATFRKPKHRQDFQSTDSAPTHQSRRRPSFGAGPIISSLAQSPQGPSKQRKFAISGMSQVELVAYSLQREDLQFAGADPKTWRELNAFRQYLMQAAHPFDTLEVEKYIAKGTAGWVFAARHRKSSTRVALKIIRMTSARSGIREWYASKILRSAGIANVVLTEDDVRVLGRDEAPLVIDQQLQDAGPCGYYMCLTQEWMDSGSFEDLSQAGTLSLEMMFKAMEDVAGTLTAMHAHSVQHMDVKPENVMLVMRDGEITAAKLCDFGRAEVGNNWANRQDDIRRFGITLYSVASGENWTQCRLLRVEHATLVSQLNSMVEDSPSEAVRRLPEFLEELLGGKMEMPDVYAKIKELRQAHLENPESIPMRQVSAASSGGY